MLVVIVVMLALAGCPHPTKISPPVSDLVLTPMGESTINLSGHIQNGAGRILTWSVTGIDSQYVQVGITGNTMSVRAMGQVGKSSFFLMLNGPIGIVDQQMVNVTITEPPAEVELNTAAVPSNGGSVHPASGTFAYGQEISLTASPAAGWQFDHWTGEVADVSTNPTTLAMTANRTITAVFVTVNPTTYLLTTMVSPSGSGEVVPSSARYNQGTVVTVKANPAEGWQFDYWTGNVANIHANPTTTTMTANRTVTAVLKKVILPIRRIPFAGRTWTVKRSDEGQRIDPGQNFFSDTENSVWIDSSGINLALRQLGGNWYCSEVFLEESLGYGTYCFSTHGRVDLLDPNLTFGLFTWSDAEKMIKHKEFDFEFSRWGNANDSDNAQFAINPFWLGMVQRYYVTLPDAAPDITHYLVWQSTYVEFRTYYGRYTLANLPPAEKLVRSWVYDREAIPVPGNEAFHFNLWLSDNNGPQNNSETVVTVSDFGWQLAVPIWPPIITVPSIEITYLPPAGSTSLMQGKVSGVNPADCRVAVYIKAYGSWWIKPYLNRPLTTINADSTFLCDIETDYHDANLTEVLAILIPSGVEPPLCNPCSNEPTIAGSLASVKVAR